jgi:hypothetical protein
VDEKLIKWIDENAIKLSNDIYAVMHNSRIVILKKLNIYGAGYDEIIGLSYDDFEKLKLLGDAEIKRLKDIGAWRYINEQKDDFMKYKPEDLVGKHILIYDDDDIIEKFVREISPSKQSMFLCQSKRKSSVNWTGDGYWRYIPYTDSIELLD